MKINRTIRLAFFLLCFLIILQGCFGFGGEEKAEQKKEIGDVDVYLGGEVEEKDDVITITGESNLLEGTRLTGEVLVDEDEVHSETTELVDENGDFTMEMEHPVYGEAEVVVRLDMDRSQEDEIIEQYGEDGEKLEGPFTYLIEHYDTDIKQKAEVSLVIQEGDEETTHAFAVPEWKDRPEDYGDPRVWMEVDEIDDDGEYFYISGTSNLLEGSRLDVSHSNSTTTRVHPDGTFDIKLEYKYEEDKPILLRFDPNSQWRTIQENYGEHGEKLVGNLVEQNSSHLRTEYSIEYE